jgi:serine/threonine protein kinase
MSPEGLIYNCYGEKTDIWAFGIIIYELLHGETPFCHCQTELELKSTVVKPLPESRFRKGIHPLLRQLINSLLEVNENKRPSVFELANDPYLKGLLNQGVQHGTLLKKRPFEKPIITLNQSFNQIPQPPQQSQPPQQPNADLPSFKNGPLFRPNSLQSPRRANKTEVNNPIMGKLDPQKKD